MDGEFLQAVVDHGTRLCRRAYRIGQQAIEYGTEDVMPRFQLFVMQAVGQYPFAELLQGKMAVPRMVPKFEGTVDVADEVFCRNMFQILLPVDRSVSISCLVSECTINGRDIILFLTDAVHRINEVMEPVHTTTYRSVPTADVGDKENGRFMFLLVVLVMVKYLF